jgi:uncharacterized RDD family membrane protein YckC
MARRAEQIPGGRARWTLFDLAEPHDRAAAWVIDAGIFWGLWAGGMIWLTETGELGTPPRLTAPRAFVWLVVVWSVWLAYDAACAHLWGTSVGRQVAGIEVRSTSGTLPDRWHAVLRAVVRTPAVLLLGAGLLSMRSDPQRRALHDRVAGTVVVRSHAVERLSAEQPDQDGGLVTPASAVQVDANERAIRRADVAAQQASWLRAIAEQTQMRLDIANPSWRRADDPGAIHYRAFCLLLVRLLQRYPDQRAVIVGVLDNHDELAEVEGNRERFLTRLLDEPERARRWIGLPDSANLRIVLDEPAWT